MLLAGFLVSGCASTIGSLTNRPVVEDSVKGVLSTVSLAADRRTVVVVTEGSNRSKFCAEPPPDTASGIKTDLDATLHANAKKAQVDGELKLKDKFETQVTVIAERTAPLDAFRTGVYALCQFHLNGAIATSEVKPLFERLVDAFLAADRPKSKAP